MKLFKKLFIKITIVILLIATTFSSRAGFISSFDYENVGSKIVTSANDITAYLGGIKDDLVHESLKQILAGITALKAGKIGAIINIFLTNTTNWNWVITEGYLPEDVNGQTQLTSGVAVTTLDYSKLKNATNLSVARTMIHEMIHAYLTLYFQYNTINANKEYPEIVTAWQASKTPDYNKIQHIEIEKNFVEDIAESLNEFGQNAGLISITESVYHDLAWGGLDFESNVLLTKAEKQRIQYRLSAEQLNTRFDTQTPVGTELVSN